TAKITDGKTGQVIFEATVEVPAGWSETAANILAQKYLRKAGVPSNTEPVNWLAPDYAQREPVMPKWLWPLHATEGATFGAETSAHQVFHRMVGCWTYHAWVEGLITEEE